MVLFFLESAEDAAAEGVGGVREFEKGEGHELDREELMIGEEVEKNGALFLVVESFHAGKG